MTNQVFSAVHISKCTANLYATLLYQVTELGNYWLNINRLRIKTIKAKKISIQKELEFLSPACGSSTSLIEQDFPYFSFLFFVHFLRNKIMFS